MLAVGTVMVVVPSETVTVKELVAALVRVVVPDKIKPEVISFTDI